MKRLRVLAWLWVTVLLGTGLAGGLVVHKVGWSLAMAMCIYGGDTEPMRPDLPYPWLVFGLAAAVSVVGLAWALYHRHRATPQQGITPFLPLALAYLAGIFAAGLPFIQLYRLWSQIG